MLQDFLREIPGRYRGPGGAIAVLRNGEVVGKQVWGYSNLDEHRLMDETTSMPICSITKQMLCLIIEDVRRNPTPKMLSTDRTFDEQMDAGLREIVSKEIIENTGLTLEHLCNNQSGIRDYWAMSMFWGTQPEGRFTLEHDAKKALSLTTSLQFEPGTQYSYSNLNFHILARVLENVTGLPLATHLSERLFAPARMQSARLCEDNARVPEWCVGYEGNEVFGFLPAKNLVEWSGDAGVLASLNDMIAYEQYLDRSWEDEQSLYRAIARVPYFKDGTSAMYGNGLARTKLGDIDIIGHGGSLRGYCLHRLQVPSERLAIVVMLNHEIDAETIAMDIVSSLLTTSQTTPNLAHRPQTDWNCLGTFFDPDAQLSFTVRGDEPGTVIVQYADHEEKVFLSTAASGSTATLFLELEGDTIEMHRIDDNRRIHARRIRAPQGIIRGDYTGRYECKEQKSVFFCDGTGEMLYGAFEGFLGKGPLHLMRYLGEDIWVLVCPRGLDAPAPGNWTLVFHRDDAGNITGVTMGCWLARNVHFTKC
ncbi:D-aminopeptidase [Penicillium diatomitis]|uniref:D-aminopeptidase n=1 Tax=Penicillium diatomitis TaxID=2819901 RepID=A0A9X0BSQ0_9EURO|nr:D-aminopeptidase [Penicillium diatomitis]KAJ5482752.1 D-aminopeptidase [Penicillium diatomitis]